MCKEAARVIIFVKQKMSVDADVTVTGANEQIKEIFTRYEFTEEIILK